MQNLKKYIVTFVFAILFGFTVVTLFPPKAEADVPAECSPQNPGCVSWSECITQTGCAADHYLYVWAGQGLNCTKCWIWHGCVMDCIPT